METATLDLVYREVVKLKDQVQSLSECFHEDFLELSQKAILDIEVSRQQIKAGEIVRFEEL